MLTTWGQPAAVAPTVIKWYSAGTSLIFGRLGNDPDCRGSCGDSVGYKPGDSASALAAAAPKATRMAATKTAASATACRPRRAPRRRPSLFVGVSISKEGRQEQEQTGWWTGTSGNGARCDGSISWAVINDPSDTSKAVVRRRTVHSRLARRPYCTSSCLLMSAPRPCCTCHPVCHARHWRHSAAESVTNTACVVGCRGPPHAAHLLGYVGSGMKENPSRVAQVIYATRPAAPAGV